MGDLLNGAGPLVAISAVPMLAGIALRDGPLASWLRRLAILLALALPAIFMLLAALYVQGSGQVFFDFQVNHQGALALYRDGLDPYSVPAAYSFPFPTFFLYWLLSGFGSLSETASWIVWWLVNALVWLVCAFLLWRTLPRPTSPRERHFLIYAAVSIPAITTIWQGQTALCILAGLTILHWAVLLRIQENQSLTVGARHASPLPPNSESSTGVPITPPFSPLLAGEGSGLRVGLPSKEILGGSGLACATLIKPQMALIGVGIALWAILAWRSGRKNDAHRAILIAVSSGMIALLLLALTILLPGGVSLDTYRQFVTVALPQVAQPADALVIGSPAFTAATLAYSLGAPGRTVDLVASIATAIVLILAAWWTWQRSQRPLIEIAAGWGVWAMVAPRVAWVWYAAWCLPFFLLTVQETLRQRRLIWRQAWIVIVLALLNLQLSSQLVATITLALLIVLLWTSFRSVTPAESRNS
jgi:hypothetical protein